MSKFALLKNLSFASEKTYSKYVNRPISNNHNYVTHFDILHTVSRGIKALSLRSPKYVQTEKFQQDTQ